MVQKFVSRGYISLHDGEGVGGADISFSVLAGVNAQPKLSVGAERSRRLLRLRDVGRGGTSVVVSYCVHVPE